MRYLEKDPISITIAGGVVVYLTSDQKGLDGKGNFHFFVDMRPLVMAVPVEDLPKGMTRRNIPDICRSRI